MPIVLPAEDVEFLRAVRRGMEAGLTQTEIAERVGLKSAGSLAIRLNSAGFAFVRDIRPIHGGDTLAELLDRDEILAREDRELAEASA
jgi:hypothetical protein